jgi:hypothetical protein
MGQGKAASLRPELLCAAPQYPKNRAQKYQRAVRLQLPEKNLLASLLIQPAL